jgi:hypothetical protein
MHMEILLNMKTSKQGGWNYSFKSGVSLLKVGTWLGLNP